MAGVLTPRRILAIAIVGVLLYAYPGIVSYDSIDQLDQARRWDLGDWHPPAMAALWRGFELVVGGPFGMLLAQTTGLVLGAFWILRDRLSPHGAALGALAIAWFPPILTVTGVIWKDGQMAGYLMLGIAALLSPRPRVRWLGVLAIFVASAVRHNAPAATLAPLVLLWRPDLPRVRRVATGLAIWVAVTAGSLATSALLTSRAQHPFPRAAAPLDINGIVRFAPPLSDAELRGYLAGVPVKPDHDLQASLAAKYEPRGNNLYFEHDPPLTEPQNPTEYAAEMRAWRRLVVAYPVAFLHHRWEMFARAIQLGHASVPPLTQTFSYIGTPELDHQLGVAGEPSLVQRGWFWWVRHCGAIWYAPVIYLAVSFVLLGFARRDRLALALILSGLGYELSVFLLAAAVDYRYQHYLMITTLLALALVIKQRSAPAFEHQ
ncbi:hypothetical protein BH11MYX1_BH11MYX1_22100 [soil metagenome]